MTGPLEQVMKEVAPNPDGGQGTMARLERRIHVLEKAFADIVERHEKSLRERSGAVSSVEESVTALNGRFDDFGKQQDQKLSELRLALSQAVLRLNALEDAKPAASIAAPEISSPELEPLVLTQEHPENSPIPSLGDLSPMSEKLALDSSNKSSDDGKISAVPEKPESYLSAARRAAMAAVETDHQMNAERDKASTRRGSRTKYVLLGCIAPGVILATAFMVLNRHTVTAQPVVESSTVAITAPAQAPVPPQAPAAVQASASPPVPTPAPAQAPAPTPPPEVVVAQPSDPTPTQLGSSETVDSLIKLAQSGDVKAARDVGLKYLAGDGVQVNDAEAAQWLMRAAYKSEPTAQYWLATLYARGHGVPADAFQANHWYEAAAKQGNRRAMHSFAVANFQGWGREKNLTEAARWFEKAAELGLVDSQFNLAVLYERGSGVPQSLTDAYKWYAIAAAQGDKEAETRVAVLATQLPPADLASAQSAVAAFKPDPIDETANAAGGRSSSSASASSGG
jgi:hypothetical protein